MERPSHLKIILELLVNSTQASLSSMTLGKAGVVAMLLSTIGKNLKKLSLAVMARTQMKSKILNSGSPQLSHMLPMPLKKNV